MVLSIFIHNRFGYINMWWTQGRIKSNTITFSIYFTTTNSVEYCNTLWGEPEEACYIQAHDLT